MYKTLPDNFNEKIEPDTKVTITDHSIYFNEDENEMDCIIKVQSINDHAGQWTYLHSYVQTTDQYKSVIDYLAKFYQQGNMNSYYPMYSVCSSKPSGYKRYYSCILSSIDLSLYSDTVSGGDEYAYGVIFDPKHGFETGLPSSVSHNMMRFTDITKGNKHVVSTKAAIAHMLATNQITNDQLNKYLHYVEPKDYMEALTYPDAKHWLEATDAEIQQMLDMGVFEFMGPEFNPKSKHIIDTKLIYKLKIIMLTGMIDKYKARLVVRGFSQIPGVEFDETYSPATSLSICRMFYILSLTYKLTLHSLDVKGAFLQSPLTDYELYIKLPDGYTAFGQHKYAKLKKSIYGLKQAAKDWYEHQNKFLLSMGFNRSTMDRCLYVYKDSDQLCMIYVHIDDYLVAHNSKTFYKHFLQQYSKYTCFETDVNDLGTPENYLQIAMKYDSSEHFLQLSNERYILQTLTRFGMQDCYGKDKPLPSNCNLQKSDTCTCGETYQQIIGSLLWIARTLRPDIMFATVYLSQFVQCANEDHLKCAKHVLKYLKKTIKHSISYSKKEIDTFLEISKSKGNNVLTVFEDASFANDHDSKSFTGYLIYLNGCLMDWCTRKQSLVATSSTEAEFIALCETNKTVLHLFQLISEFFPTDYPVKIYCDSESAQKMAENNLNSRRTKHILIVYRFVTDWINRGLIKLFHIDTTLNLADYMTKVPKDVNYIQRSYQMFDSLINAKFEKATSFNFSYFFQ